MTINQNDAAHSYISRFEEDFATYIDEIASIIVQTDPSAGKHPIQALVNAYHDLGKTLGPTEIPNFNTLTMLVRITGATMEHSGQNESLAILEYAKSLITN
ncbi:hypothetical protein [Undibacterium griseum]|uniref:Uncharacterized protein n=1 Tax=Undibacterium griseum TaxID=2762295 RepID=A0ABR6YIS8_9BURK|nr:hypothetical protein [Undibacterium griseum]MBC3883759.1 hypothetical protein [Undibacterium griseum]